MSGADTNPGIYPGNPSLPREVRDKILSTFRHTLNLYKENKLDDCLIGCDFILKMDPRFGPARKLMEKSKNPSAEVDVAELEALVAGTMTRQERVVAAEPDRLLVRAVESYNARDFDAAAAAAGQVLEVLPGNQDAIEILEKARRKKAAQPQVEAAKQKAVAALQAKDMAGARAELERMKALDPDHPAVALLEGKVGSAPARPAPPPPPPPPAMSLEEALGGASSEPSIAFDEHSTVAIRLDDAAFAEPAAAEVKPPPAAQRGGSSLLAPSEERPMGKTRVQPPSAQPADSLDGLSLDGLSLDEPAAAPAPPPAPPPGSPADLWGEAPPSMEVESIGEMAAEEPHPIGSSMPSLDLDSLEPPPAPAEAAPASELKSIQDTEKSPSEREIEGLLKQGDEMARRGDRQQAIEIWSRIFLIDINNSEAVLRIEKARQDMAEGNRKIADGLKSGREAFEAGDLAVAREMFLQVLAVDENEPTAKFYLDRIEEELTTPSAGGGAKGAGDQESAVPADAAPAPAAAVAKPKTVRLPVPPKTLGLALVFLLLAGGGVWYVMRQPGRNAPPPSVSTAKSQIDDAATLVKDGKVNEAIAVLKRVPATDPEYPRAKKMLDELTKTAASGPPAASAGAATAPGGPGAAPPPPAAATTGTQPTDPAQLRAAAEKALAEKRYIDALKNFNLALPAYSSDPTFSQSMGIAAERVTELTPAVKLFNDAEYETAIPVLWRILHEDRDNRDARSYLLRCYFNQGISQLQNGLFPKALQSFNEVLQLDPNDIEAQRHKKFAERYQKADLDLLGRIYVRHIPHRP
jgi:tetratricopeptide (TPR) repeat protein